MKWPPKRGGACSNAPTPNLTTGCALDNHRHSFAQPCNHSATRTERLPGSYPHYAREVCAFCGLFLRWLPKPETIERQKLNAFKLARLAMRPDLTDWQRAFVRDISKRRKLSPRQQEILDKLIEKYLGAKTS